MAQLIGQTMRLERALRVLCLVVIGCGDDGPAVPFKLGEEAHAPVEQPQATPASDTPTPTANPPADDTSAFTLALDDARTVRLQRKNDDGTSQPVATLGTLGAGCTLSQPQVVALSNAHLAASARIECPALAMGSDKDPQPVQGQIAQDHWVLERSEAPRVLEHLRLRPAQAGAPLDDLQLQLRGQDADNDGNSDVVATLSVAAASDAMQSVELRWLNRASGLDRDEAEPETTIAKLAKQAKALRADDPVRAQTLAAAILVHRVLCAESGQARVEVSDHVGVRCGRSQGAGLAWALYAKQRASDADAMSAVETLEQLSGSTLNVASADRDAATAALQARATRAGWQWKPGPEVAEMPGPAVRLPRIGFIDDHTLLLRGATTQRFDLLTGSVTDEATTKDLLVRDPSGRFAIVAIERHCDGLHLKVVEAAQVIGAQVLGQPVSEPLFDRAPDADRCATQRASKPIADDGGFRVLGWSPKGIVVARGPDRRFVPMQSDGRAGGETSRLGAELPLPSPLASGTAASDGSAVAYATSVAIAVQGANDGAGTIVAPLGPVSIQDVAVAPGGQHLAYVFGNRVFIGTAPSATRTP